MTAETGGGPDLVTELTESLRLSRRELKLVRGQQEACAETLQQVRRQRAALREQVRLASDALAGLLSERYWADQRKALVVGRFRAGHGGSEERELVSAIEASDLFDGGWYLRQQPDAVRNLLSPAVHYLRFGAREGAEPGPRFNTRKYLDDHPEARESDLPALLHHLRGAGG